MGNRSKQSLQLANNVEGSTGDDDCVGGVHDVGKTSSLMYCLFQLTKYLARLAYLLCRQLIRSL